MGEDETILAMLPFFHIYGMIVVMKLALAGGATVVSMPRFDMEEFLGLVQRVQRRPRYHWFPRSYWDWPRALWLTSLTFRV